MRLAQRVQLAGGPRGDCASLPSASLRPALRRLEARPQRHSSCGFRPTSPAAKPEARAHRGIGAEPARADWLNGRPEAANTCATSPVPC